MNIFEKSKALGKAIVSPLVIAYHNFQSALNDTARMCEADNKIYAVSSGAFCRAFSNVANQICYARTSNFADTYCSLAEEAIAMLLSGASEAYVLYHFDEKLIQDKGSDG